MLVATVEKQSVARKVASAVKLLEKARNHLGRNEQERLEVRYVQPFFEIAAQPEITYQELEKRLGCAQPIVTRYVQLLGPGNYKEGPGLGLLTEWRDHRDQRIKLVKLNEKGRKVLAQMLEGVE